MTLRAAFSVGRGDLVAAVGAGGKTTLLRSLARQCREAGLTVMTTTTTHMGAPDDGPVVVAADSDVRRDVDTAIRAHGHVTLLGRRVRDDKMEGVGPSVVDGLRDLADVVLVEADGARGRSLKMPAAHEPAIPSAATLVIVVAALDVLGQRLDAQRIHRLDVVTSSLGLEAGTTVDADVVARALSASYPAHVPPLARSAVFLNKADAHGGAAEIAGRLRATYAVVVAGSARAGIGERLGEA